MANFEVPECRQYAQKVASEAYQKGFSSEQEMTLYANVLGYLAGQPLIEHPEIAQLLAGTAAGAPLARVERAAELAEKLAADRQGSLQ
jgi:hypothetical protein